MRKKIYAAVLLLVMTGMFAGCGKNTEDGKSETTAEMTAEDVQAEENKTDEQVTGETDIDVQTVADTILKNGDFKDNLAVVDNSMALGRLYNLDAGQIEASAFYTNSNATAEEIAVIKTTSSDYVDTVKAAYETRVSGQQDACRDYLPDEMTKLESAVIYVNGNYVILCISNDNTKAEGIIEDIFK